MKNLCLFAAPFKNVCWCMKMVHFEEKSFAVWRKTLHSRELDLSSHINLIDIVHQLDSFSLVQMDTLYTTGHIHGFPASFNISSSTTSFYNPIGNSWGSQEGVVALGVVLGSSISLVGLAFAFITYRWVRKAIRHITTLHKLK